MQQTKLDRIQLKALKIILGLRMSTPSNFVLAEAKEPPLSIKTAYLCDNWMVRVLSQSEHLILTILDKYIKIEENPLVVNGIPPSLIFDSFKRFVPISHLIISKKMPLCYENNYESLTFQPPVDLQSGINFDKDSSNNEILFKETLVAQNIGKILVYLGSILVILEMSWPIFSNVKLILVVNKMQVFCQYCSAHDDQYWLLNKYKCVANMVASIIIPILVMK